MVDYPELFQLQVIRRLVALIEGVNPTAEDPAWALCGLDPQNYDTDLRGSVLIGRTIVGSEQPVPFVSILEDPNPGAGVAAGQEGRVKRQPFRLLVQGFAADDRKNPTVPAYRLMGQVLGQLNRAIDEKDESGKPLYPDDFYLGGLVSSLVIGQGVVRPPEEKVSPTAFFYIPLVVNLATDTRNPYKPRA